MQLKKTQRSEVAASLFALVLALLISNSLAGRDRSFMTDQGSLRQHDEGPETKQNESPRQVYGRMLNVKTNDYGTYDPAPSTDKPHFKLIPN
uniref:Uncharacterized protein n=1 Tax=Leersia perrieri TaxID=77586 RepID=A0A0D9WMK5_9ORYZ